MTRIHLAVVSGGDAPGINTALLELVQAADLHGDIVLGATGGFAGLVAGRVARLHARDLVAYAGLGGSSIRSSRDPVLKEAHGREQLATRLREHAVDDLILFGGNGTLRYIPPILADLGVATVGIPTTIDNDIGGTDTTLGFDTACNYAYHVIDGIRATAHALEGRFFTLETLGGDVGTLALAIADGAGADAVLVPEYTDYSLDHIAAHLKAAAERKGHALLVYTEFIPMREQVLRALPDMMGMRLRDTRLGHAQRGGAASHRDRVLARTWARMAIDALGGGLKMGVVVERGGRLLVHEGLLDGYAAVPPDHALYMRINRMGTGAAGPDQVEGAAGPNKAEGAAGPDVAGS